MRNVHISTDKSAEYLPPTMNLISIRKLVQINKSGLWQAAWGDLFSYANSTSFGIFQETRINIYTIAKRR